jgi:uncharacterized glyoxalase superfamily protein PhnB/uncharacterized protein YndB with AHSA1/START domain
MKSPILQFDFTVNKSDKTIDVHREFAADLSMVWDAWTRPEILDQWWAPKPYLAKTKSMDFKAGGQWLYCMISPTSEVHWSKFDYEKIVDQQYYEGLDAFCDEEGVTNTTFPRNQWATSFEPKGEHTLVKVQMRFENLESLENLVKMGFKEGFTAGMENLDAFLSAQFALRKANKPDRKARVTSYLNFPGNTEEAFLFYKAVFKSEFVNGIKRLGDAPPHEGQPPMSDEVKKMILHIELPILSGCHTLMGTDAPKEFGFTVISGNNQHIYLDTESRDEAKRLFDALADNGEVEIPIQDMFFGSYFGNCKDKYGINWMINHQG